MILDIILAILALNGIWLACVFLWVFIRGHK